VKYMCVLPCGKDVKLITKENASTRYENQIMPCVNEKGRSVFNQF